MPRSMLGRWTPAFVAGGVLPPSWQPPWSSGQRRRRRRPTAPAVRSRPSTDTTVVGGTARRQHRARVHHHHAGVQPDSPDARPNGAGAEVKALQQRLNDLGFDPGPIDGYYGDATTRQRSGPTRSWCSASRASRPTGKVTPETWASMQNNIEILPKRPRASPTHLEVYLQPQVAVLFKDNQPILITHVSTGSGETWTEEVTIDPGTDENQGTEPITKVLTGNVDHPRRGVHVQPSLRRGRRVADRRARPDVQAGVLQLRRGGARLGERAQLAGVARVRPHPDAHRRVLPRPGQAGRPGLRVRRGEGARGLRAPAAAVRPGHHPDDHDHDRRPPRRSPPPRRRSAGATTTASPSPTTAAPSTTAPATTAAAVDHHGGPADHHGVPTSSGLPVEVPAGG